MNSHEVPDKTKPTFSIVDERTGEIVGSNLQWVTSSAGSNERLIPNFIRITPNGLGLLIQAGLLRSDWLVLALCMREMSFENLLVINMTWAAKELGLSRETVSRSFSELILKGILKLVTGATGTRCWLVNPEVCWKGSDSAYKKNREAYWKEKQKQFDCIPCDGIPNPVE